MKDINSLLGFQPKTPQTSSIYCDTGNGYGADLGTIRRFSQVRSRTGSAITYRDYGGDGTWFLVSEPGIYYIAYTDVRSGGSSDIGIFCNTGVPNSGTNPGSGTYAQGKRVSTSTPGANLAGTCSTVQWLNAGDVVTAQTDTNANGTSLQTVFVMIKLSA